MKPDSRHQTLGQVIVKARKAVPLKLKDAAALIIKEDETSISYQYLSELENDRCNPPSDRVLDELARVLKIPRNYLYFLARRLPPDFPVPKNAKLADSLYNGMRKKVESSLAA